MAVKGRRNPPHAAFALAEFGLLLRRVLVQSIRRVRDNCMNRIVFLLSDPIKAIRMVKNGSSHTDRFPPRLHERKIPRYPSHRSARSRVGTPRLTDE